jgi:transmembrane sensor
MNELRNRVRNELGDRTTEQEVQRIWAGIQRRRLRRPVLSDRRVIGLAFVVGVAAIAVLLFWPRRAAQDLMPGPLLTKDGRTVTTLGGQQPSLVEFNDGSQLELDAASDLEVVENNAHTWMSLLHAGRVTFDVRPGGPRRWTIEAGLATVEVIGTRFELSRTADALEVGVTRGAVLVRGERVRDRVKKLAAGERLVVRATETRPGELEESAVLHTNGKALPGAPEVSTIGAPGRADARAVPSIGDLLGQADAKRRSGDLMGAESTLRRILALHAREPRASLAAFTLGKLLFDTRPADAAQAFSLCLALSPPDALAEDAQARLVEAEARSGATARARAAAKEYRRRYANGRWLDAMKKWADADE